jgi:hypothetical protein
VVYWGGVSLNNECVNASNRLFVAHEGLAVGEVVSGGWQQLGAKDVCNLLSKLWVSATTNQD